jgi:small subunit ribosomal protein S1
MNEDSKKEQETTDPPTVEVETTAAVETEEKVDASPVSDEGTQSEEQPTAENQPQDEEQGVQPTEEAEENGEEISLSEGESDEVDATDETPSVDESAAVEASADAPEATPELVEIESLEEAYDNSLKAFSEGEIVKGTVINVDHDEVMVDIGFKSEGYIPVSEFPINDDRTPTVNVGDQIDVYIVRREDSEGQLVLSKEIADQKLVWDEITEAYEAERVVTGTVVQRIKGGLQVDLGKLRAFLPASQIELRPPQDFEQYIGQALEVKVVKLSKRRRNIVLSRRVILEEELAAQKTALFENIETSQVRSGLVKSITTFGAFVDLGGIDGLLHKTDMSWRRVNHPSEVVAVGDEIEIMVISVDRDAEKVSLGLKQKTLDPWESVEEKYPIGSTVTGKVVGIVNYGAFLELEEGVEGLIHISEMSWTRRHIAPSKVVVKDDVIDAVVLDIDKANQKLSLGLKQLHLNPWELLETKYPVGTKLTGRVRNLTNFGAFVEIEEGIDGLIHISDLSWLKRIVDPREVLKEGDEVEVMVLSIDPAQQKISLGLKQIEPDPWIEVPNRYKIGSVVRGKVVNITSFGVFAQLEDDIEGLIHISELAEQRIEKPEDIVSVGQELNLKVIHLDPTERRIGLSLKAAQAEQERATITQYQQEQEERPRTQQKDREELTAFGGLLKEELNRSGSEDTSEEASEKVSEEVSEENPEETSEEK